MLLSLPDKLGIGYPPRSRAMQLMKCRIFASQTAESTEDLDPRLPETRIYEYDAPAGFEEMVGRGVLFTCIHDTNGMTSRVEILGLAEV